MNMAVTKQNNKGYIAATKSRAMSLKAPVSKMCMVLKNHTLQIVNIYLLKFLLSNMMPVSHSMCTTSQPSYSHSVIEACIMYDKLTYYDQ
jgi:hypothetical protein